MYGINDNCIKCGVCASIADSLFVLNDDSHKAQIKKNPESPEEIKMYEDAQSSCPAQAIES